jgi:hypothetical protein
MPNTPKPIPPYHDPALQGHFDRKKRRAICRMAQSCRVDAEPFCQLAGIDFPKYKASFQGSKDEETAAAIITAMWDQVAVQLPAENMLQLWNAVSEVIQGGVQTTQDPIIGDPFAVFLTGICKEMHEGKGWYKQTSVIKTGHRVDQKEAEKMQAYLKAQDNVRLCEDCGSEITTWSLEVTRVSTFAAQDRRGREMTIPYLPIDNRAE